MFSGIDCGWGTCLLEPQFISHWSKIIAQDLTHSSAISEHGIGSVPLKVDVQIRPEDSQPENHFYFPGIGSSQRDDDVNSPYGDIVYYYNQESVSLFSPIKQDGFDPDESFLQVKHNILNDNISQKGILICLLFHQGGYNIRYVISLNLLCSM